MNDVISSYGGLPQRRLAKGECLIEEGVRTDRLYVLKSGAFEVLRDGVRVVVIGEPGAFMGEISAVLGAPPTASVAATQDSTVYVIDNAAATVRRQPELLFAIAQVLARRLAAVTAYLVDIKNQYADSNTHLGLMDQVLGQLIAMNASPAEHGPGTAPGSGFGSAPGSERGDLPDY